MLTGASYSAAIGFNVESVTYKNIKFQVWDLGGQTSIRPYWRCYYPNTQAIIYVVDSSDTERVGTSREEFHAILQEEELKDALLLVYANKQVWCMQIINSDGISMCVRVGWVLTGFVFNMLHYSACHVLPAEFVCRYTAMQPLKALNHVRCGCRTFRVHLVMLR